MSWQAAAGGYELFFNRDERHTRAPESAPRFGWTHDVAWLAPRDGDHGGTWLLVNDRGLTIGLLNDYACAWQPSDRRPRRSRGLVPLACAAAADHRDVFAAIRDLELAATPAFTAFALEADGTAAVWRWDGEALVADEAAAEERFLSSSSFATAEVIAARHAAFTPVRRRKNARADLETFHRRHDPARGAHSVLMRRPDAATRSVSHVRVTEGVASFAYTAVRWNAEPAPELAPATQYHLNLANTPAAR